LPWPILAFIKVYAPEIHGWKSYGFWLLLTHLRTKFMRLLILADTYAPRVGESPMRMFYDQLLLFGHYVAAFTTKLIQNPA